MRSSRSAESRAARRLWALLATLLAGIVTGSALGAGFEVEHAETRLVDGVYLLDAQLDISFSEEALEALESGVPLTVIVDLDIVEPRRYVWNKSIARLESRHQLRTHPLSSQYIVENLNSGAARAFRSLADAVAALGELEAFPVLDEYLLKPGKAYNLKLRARLDIEALPAPLRPVAYLSSLWRQDSEWSTWPIER